MGSETKNLTFSEGTTISAPSLTQVKTAAATDASHAVRLDQMGLKELNASTNPTSGDDSGDGYQIGSSWFNSTTGQYWVATSVGVGTATWQEIGSSSAAINDLTDVVITSPANGEVLKYVTANTRWENAAL